MDQRLEVGYTNQEYPLNPGCDVHDGMEILIPSYMTSPVEHRELTEEEQKVRERQLAIRNLLIPS